MPTLFLLLASPLIGSFLANFAIRLPEGRSVLLGRSRCAACGQNLQTVDLVPVLSWLALRGKCRRCGGKIAVFYPAVELATFGIAAGAVSALSGWSTAAGFLFGAWLLLLALIDAQHFWLPDMLTLPLIPAGLAIALALTPNAATDHFIGAAAGFLVFYTIAKLYRLTRGRDGLGQGDAKLLAGIGAFVAWQGLPLVILLAASAGLCFAGLRALIGRPVAADERIPFGPFLAAAGWLVFLYGNFLPLAGG